MIADLRVLSLVHGGEALARHEGRVVFLRGAVPGDLVQAELSGEGRFEHARALRVLERSSARVDAPCPIVERCGGCPLQSVALAAQASAKAGLAADALERVGGFARGSYQLADLVESPLQFRYRRRARMHRAGPGLWGFAQAGSARIEPVRECLLFEPALQALADLVRAAGDLPGVTDVGLLSGEKKGALDLRTEGTPTPGLRKRAEKLCTDRLVKGVVLGPRGAPELIGDPVLADAPLANGARLRARPDTFAQANRGAVPLLQAEVLRALGEAKNVLELFCGTGTLTLPLLGGGRAVAAVESEGLSLGLLRRSANEANLPVHLLAGDAAAAVRGLLSASDEALIARGFNGPIDAVLLDPPRTGAAGVIKDLARLAPARIVYVSCDAPTLARDGRALADAGYHLVRAVPFDLFPQTAHFEIVATFARQ